jgi:Mrp family chromosome partitioning ATPase
MATLGPMGGSNTTAYQGTGRKEVLHGSRSLALPTYMVWGADTDVGKTLVSAALAAAAARAQVHVMFPVS